ncbi:AAA family ATPase [Actinoplanes sp. NBC_00393]|uniref:ATP-binding protein n=1 Tax=Actinoplanes sp. NBC_00393 TaxID=2975953 RepID=UPI002E1C1F8F
MLEIRLFGTFELRADGEPVVLTSARAQSLLAYLALRRGEPQRRDRVAGLLWPESSEAQARTNLRHLLHTLRAALPDAGRQLDADARTVALRDVYADTAAFDAAYAAGDWHTAAGLAAGDLLEGCDDAWLDADRLDYRRRLGIALERAVASADRSTAIGYAERARALDPLAERPYRMLIRLYDEAGDRARAVRVYHDCVTVLEQELGVAPSAQTRARYEALLPAGGAAPRGAEDAALVGRGPQRRRLIELWRAAPHLVVLTGEPGIGKTRLAEEFRQWAAGQGAATATARSYRAEGTLAYAPVVHWLRAGLPRWRRRLAPAELAVLAVLLPELGVEPAPPEPGSRLRLFEAAAHALRADGRALLLVADDLHAADAPTCQFLHYLLRDDHYLLRGDAGRLLVVATVRAGEAEPGHPLHQLLAGLGALGRCTELPLEGLDGAETAQLAGHLGHTVDAERLHRETGGNPLFVVEALRAGLRVLTPRVQAVLLERLRPLSPGARELLELAATAGGSVAVDVLTRVHPRAVAADLDELWRRRLLVTSGGETYDFSHDKLREVAYRQVPPARRRRNHALLAAALIEVYADAPDTVAGRIAAHLHAAGSPGAAIDWYQRAATAAQQRYADAEAAELLLRAAELTRGADRELEVLTGVPGPLSSAEGYASPRLRAVLDRAFALAGARGTEPAAPLLRAQAMAVLSRGDFAAAAQYGARLRALGDTDDVLAVEGDFVRGVAAAWRNETGAARAHLSAALQRYRPQNRGAHLLGYGQDPQVLCLIRLAHVHFCRAEPADAEHRQRQALDLARQGAHPFTLAGALLFAALLDLDRGDLPGLRERVAELNRVRERVDAAPIRLCGEAFTGYLAVLDGSAEAGLRRIDQALDDPGRDTAPGVPAMLLRIRLAAALAAGQQSEAAESAKRLLAGDVRIWDTLAEDALTG